MCKKITSKEFVCETIDLRAITKRIPPKWEYGINTKERSHKVFFKKKKIL